MIKACVFMPGSEDDCQSVIDLAQENLDSILPDNVKQLLEALGDKMNEDGIVIYNGYAQFTKGFASGSLDPSLTVQPNGNITNYNTTATPYSSANGNGQVLHRVDNPSVKISSNTPQKTTIKVYPRLRVNVQNSQVDGTMYLDALDITLTSAVQCSG